MAKPACGAVTERGVRCRAFALASGRCWNHDPDRSAERHAARSKGGRLKALQGRRLRLERAGLLSRFLADLIQDVLAARVNVDLARTAIYGASVLRQVVETRDLEARLEALEAQLGSSGRRLG